MRFNFILLLLFFFTQYYGQDSTSVHPESIIRLGEVQNIGEVQKGNTIEFEFYVDFNREVVLEVYSENGDLQSSNTIEVYSDKGLAIATRGFEPGTYYFCLYLATNNQIKKVIIIE